MLITVADDSAYVRREHPEALILVAVTDQWQNLQTS